MAYTAPLFTTTPTLGVDLSSAGLNQPFSLTTATPEYPGANIGPVTPGTVINFSNRGKAVYAICTAAALAIGDVCYITGGTAAVSNFAVGLTSTLAATAGNGQLGVAMAALTTSQGGWFQTEGQSIYGVHVVAGVAAGATLHTSATAGVLTGTATTGTTYIVNAVTLTATSAATSQAWPAVIGQGFSINTASTLG